MLDFAAHLRRRRRDPQPGRGMDLCTLYFLATTCAAIAAPTYGTPEWPSKWSGEENAVIGKCWPEIEFCENWRPVERPDARQQKSYLYYNGSEVVYEPKASRRGLDFDTSAESHD